MPRQTLSVTCQMKTGYVEHRLSWQEVLLYWGYTQQAKLLLKRTIRLHRIIFLVTKGCWHLVWNSYAKYFRCFNYQYILYHECRSRLEWHFFHDTKGHHSLVFYDQSSLLHKTHSNVWRVEKQALFMMETIIIIKIYFTTLQNMRWNLRSSNSDIRYEISSCET